MKPKTAPGAPSSDDGSRVGSGPSNPSPTSTGTGLKRSIDRYSNALCLSNSSGKDEISSCSDPTASARPLLSKNIADQAVLAGYSVLFRTAADLLDDVQCDSPERRRQRIAAYTRPQLLCIDEIGYLSYDDHAADLLYKVINPRYEKRRSLLVSTNLAFKDWNGIFPNATCIVTLIDRLTHHADVTLIEGDSYRRRESEAEATVRRKARSS